MPGFWQWPPFSRPAGSTAVLAALDDIKKQLGEIMSEQSDIDAAVTEFTTVLGDLQTQTASLVTDLQELQAIIAAGQPVDTSALDSVVASASAVQSALDAAVAGINTEAAPPASS